MKKKLLVLATAITATACLAATACSKAPTGNYAPNYFPSYDFSTSADGDNYQYGAVTESPFVNVTQNSSSYFSLDRNTAGYSYVRRQITNGWKISENSVRVEELINYFDYSYPEPETDAVSLSVYLSDCPWNSENKLVTLGVKTQKISLDGVNGNYVFLVDVSGSMAGDDRLELAKYGFNTLVDNLGGGDTVSIVKYASGMGVVTEGVECTEGNKEALKGKMNGLKAYGATNGAGGLELAYETAQRHFITGGNNRVIIISDGDFNVGKSGVDDMKELIQEKAKSGVYLSVIGVGMGNTRDDLLETLATCGNGNYAYLDNELEAKKVFGHDLNGTLKTVAKDAKAGVTFTENVVKYRLVGYDTKHLSEDDFNDGRTDAGELGSGLCSTAVYEITLKDGAEGKIATAEIKYKD
ncbi:MAG: von Willebrand factor type A domain-containing protein, partial [Clostridia bacterium]|nr:von Willebrand factor type A domain-containing protein [Clostridia bacterium]